jgi:hypothetical protein
MRGSDLHDAERKARAAQLHAVGAARGQRPPKHRWLDPVQRTAEVVCGVLVTMLFTGAFAVLGSDARTLSISALAAGAAWSALCALLYLRQLSLARLWRQRFRSDLLAADTPAAFAQQLHGELPQSLIDELRPAEVHRVKTMLRDAMRQEPTPGANFRAAAMVLLIVFAGTLPVALPLLWTADVDHGLRLAHGLAIAVLFVLGGFLGHHGGLRPVLFAGCLAGLGALLAGLCWWLRL